MLMLVVQTNGINCSVPETPLEMAIDYVDFDMKMAGSHNLCFVKRKCVEFAGIEFAGI